MVTVSNYKLTCLAQFLLDFDILHRMALVILSIKVIQKTKLETLMKALCFIVGVSNAKTTTQMT